MPRRSRQHWHWHRTREHRWIAKLHLQAWTQQRPPRPQGRTQQPQHQRLRQLCPVIARPAWTSRTNRKRTRKTTRTMLRCCVQKSPDVPAAQRQRRHATPRQLLQPQQQR